MKLSVKDLDLSGKRVFIRVDFNVPIKNGVDRRRHAHPRVAAHHPLRARQGRHGDPGVAPRAPEGEAGPGVQPRSRWPRGCRSCSDARWSSRATASASPRGRQWPRRRPATRSCCSRTCGSTRRRRRTIPRSPASSRRSRTLRRRRVRLRAPGARLGRRDHQADRPRRGRPADGQGAAVPRPRARDAGAPVRRGARRRESLGQDRGDREHARQGRRAAHRRRDGLHVPQGARRADREIAGRGGSARQRARDHRQGAASVDVRLELPVDHVVAPALDANAPHETLAIDDRGHRRSHGPRHRAQDGDRSTPT